MRICITGSLGHLGSALLCDLGKDHDVLAIDNLSSNHHAVLFSGSLNCHVRFRQEDILYADLPTLFDGHDVVIHLAAITDAAHSHLHKEEVETTNYLGAEKVGQACAQVGAKMIFPSSTSVYGVSEGIVDELGEVKPQSPYAWSKLNAERSLQAIPNLRVSIMRFGTIYGLSTGARVHTAVNQFAWNAAIGKPLEVWKTAWNQQRPYLFLEDAISAIRHAIDKDLFNKEVYNVVTGNHSVSEVIAEIQKYRPYLKIQLTDSPLMNQLSYIVSCAKFERTGWRASGTLSDGMRQEMETLSWVNA